MSKLYPGISQVAASRMEHIAGSYASMSNAEQVAFTRSLREARKRGAKAKAIKGKVESDEKAETVPVTDREEAQGDAGSVEGANSESSEHPEGENAGG